MATYTIDKIGYNGNTYLLQDAGALQLTGGNVTGPVNFGSSVSMDEATIGDLVVNGAASFTNNLQANTINGVTVGSSPKFTDTITTVTTTGSGNAVTAISASNGALTVTKGTTFLTSHQTYTAFTGKPTANATPGFGGTVTISQISQATSGQVSGTDRTITIPSTIATNTAVGLVKPWYNHTAASTGPTAGSNATAVTVNAISTTSGKYYAIEADNNGRLFVNVPWVNDNTDTLVTQAYSTTSNSYPLLMTATAGVSSTSSRGATTAILNNTIYANPSTGIVTTSGLTTKKVNELLTGSGTAASDKGSGVSPRYFPAKWTFNTGFTLTDGDIITIKIPVAGHTYGVYLSIDNGTTYKPVVLNGTGRLTTHYGVNTYITLVYESAGSAASIYAVTGGDATTTITGGAWRVINYYDSNSDTYTTAYCGTAAATAAKAATMTYYTATANRYVMVNMRYANTSQTALTLNINSTGAKPIYINGNASSTSNYTLPAGSYLVFYDGTNYYFRTDNIITGNITGNAATASSVAWSGVSGKPNLVNTITTTAGTHTAISSQSGNVSFNVPTTAAHVGIKFGYTTSGNNRAVQQDSSGNLYVVQKDDNNTYTLSGLGGIGTISASGTAPLTLSASKSGTTVTITGSVAAVSSSSAGVAPKGATVSSQTQSTKFLREDGTWAAPSYTVNTNTDTLVTQTATSTNANYEVLFSATADNTTRTETARKNSNLTFNPSTGVLTATKLIGEVPEANLTWGGKDFSASYGPIDAAMIDTLGANRFAFLKAAGLTIEYSTNGGSSYTDYGATDAQKVGLFSSGQSFHLGKHTSSGSCTTNDRLRVTIDTGAAGIYTVLNKIAIYMSTNGSTVQVLIERALQSTPTTFQTHKDWTGISGWSGWNILNISGLTTYGNTAGSQYGRIRFTFKATAVNTNYAAAQISKIQGYGGQGWTVPSNMAANGHLYSYDSSQNATFPGKVTASGGFSGDLTGNVTGNVSGSAGSVAWSGVTGKPTATGSKTTGISIAAHTTTSITPVSGSVTASKASGGNGSASNWVFEDVACDDITAWSAGSFTRGTFSGGSGSFTQGAFSGGSGSFSATVSSHVLSFSHTHNAATHGADTHTHTAATHAADSFTAPSLSYSAKTASHVKSGGNGSAPTWSFTNVTVPKAASAVNVVTSTGHTITDNGHTHSIS